MEKKKKGEIKAPVVKKACIRKVTFKWTPGQLSFFGRVGEGWGFWVERPGMLGGMEGDNGIRGAGPLREDLCVYN